MSDPVKHIGIYFVFTAIFVELFKEGDAPRCITVELKNLKNIKFKN